MPDENEVVASIKERRGFFHVWIRDVELLPAFPFKGEAETTVIQINRALAPIVARAKAADDMANVLEDALGIIQEEWVEQSGKDIKKALESYASISSGTKTSMPDPARGGKEGGL